MSTTRPRRRSACLLRAILRIRRRVVPEGRRHHHAQRRAVRAARPGVLATPRSATTYNTDLRGTATQDGDDDERRSRAPNGGGSDPDGPSSPRRLSVWEGAPCVRRRTRRPIDVAGAGAPAPGVGDEHRRRRDRRRDRCRRKTDACIALATGREMSSRAPTAPTSSLAHARARARACTSRRTRRTRRRSRSTRRRPRGRWPARCGRRSCTPTRRTSRSRAGAAGASASPAPARPRPRAPQLARLLAVDEERVLGLLGDEGHPEVDSTIRASVQSAQSSFTWSVSGLSVHDDHSSRVVRRVARLVAPAPTACGPCRCGTIGRAPGVAVGLHARRIAPRRRQAERRRGDGEQVSRHHANRDRGRARASRSDSGRQRTSCDNNAAPRQRRFSKRYGSCIGRNGGCRQAPAPR